MYDPEDPPSAAYAERCDLECPKEWDDGARKELGIDE
jgi:hypothetical protein